jgi:hypothetical protein
MAVEFEKTGRGFAIGRFTDVGGTTCTIQKSSTADEDRIWLGAEEIGLKHFKAYKGWSDVVLVNTVEEHYIANTRMHLNREQVAALLPILQRFVETGEID